MRNAAHDLIVNVIFAGNAGVRQSVRRPLRGDAGDAALCRARKEGQNKGRC